MAVVAFLTQLVRGEGANNAIVDVLDLVKRVDMCQPRYESNYLQLSLTSFILTIAISIASSFDSESLLSSLAAYEKDVFARAEPSFLNSRQACLDAHDFSKIEGSPLVGLRDLKKSG